MRLLPSVAAHSPFPAHAHAESAAPSAAPVSRLSAGTHIMQARASERATRVLVVSIETVVSRLSSFCSMPAFATCAARRSARRTAASAARRAWQCWACCNLRAERIVHIVGVGTRATATAHVCGSLTTPTRGQSSTLPSPPCSRRRARMRALRTLRTARARARSRGRAARAPPTRIRTAAAARAARQPATEPSGVEALTAVRARSAAGL